MRICLVSDAPEFCSTLNGYKDASVFKVSPQRLLAEADLYIWDYDPESLMRAETLRDSAQHLVLVDSKHIDSLQGLEQLACILLKPVNSHTLRTFVDLAFKTWKLREQACLANTLRSDRDTLLQYVLEVNLKLQEYDHERSNFLARALHDFRAPLTALHGYCGLLAEEKIGSVNAKQRELLERMRHSTTRLTRLATGTLDLLLQGRFEKAPQYKLANIEATIHQAIHDIYPFVQEKNINLNARIEPPGFDFLFEAEQIQQVLVNLLENSCKFVPRNGSIEIHGYSMPWRALSGTQVADTNTQTGTGHVYRIDISDSGPGVAADLVDKIFEQYASYGGSQDRSGGGLGLAICKRIIVAHRGKIWATSGQGGHFSVVLPLQLSSEAVSKEGSAELLLEPERVGY